MNYPEASRSDIVHEGHPKRSFRIHWQVGRGVSTFDPMAAAIDWLDAYRAGSLSIVNFYASDAPVECSCGGTKVARGRAAISDYWLQRFAERPAGS